MKPRSISEKSPTFQRKCPTFFGKSPTFLRKSPTFFGERPLFLVRLRLRCGISRKSGEMQGEATDFLKPWAEIGGGRAGGAMRIFKSFEGQKRAMRAWIVKSCPKSSRKLLATRVLQRNLWRLWKQKAQNSCRVRARVRAREGELRLVKDGF